MVFVLGDNTAGVITQSSWTQVQGFKCYSPSLYLYHLLVMSLQVDWTLFPTAVDMGASAWMYVAVFVRTAGPAGTAQRHDAQVTAQARACAWTESVCATATSLARTAQRLAVPVTALAGGCASTGSACVRRPTLGRTAPWGAASMTALTGGSASTAHVGATWATLGRTAA